VISLAQFTVAYTRGGAANSINARMRLRTGRDRVNQELAQLREELRIKDARMARINPHRRPHYPPTERMAILELRAARGWSLEETALVLYVTAPTIASWIKLSLLSCHRAGCIQVRCCLTPAALEVERRLQRSQMSTPKVAGR
jgi:hypothetical protein